MSIKYSFFLGKKNEKKIENELPGDCWNINFLSYFNAVRKGYSMFILKNSHLIFIFTLIL